MPRMTTTTLIFKNNLALGCWCKEKFSSLSCCWFARSESSGWRPQNQELIRVSWRKTRVKQRWNDEWGAGFRWFAISDPPDPSQIHFSRKSLSRRLFWVQIPSFPLGNKEPILRCERRHHVFARRIETNGWSWWWNEMSYWFGQKSDINTLAQCHWVSLGDIAQS